MHEQGLSRRTVLSAAVLSCSAGSALGADRSLRALEFQVGPGVPARANRQRLQALVDDLGFSGGGTLLLPETRPGTHIGLDGPLRLRNGVSIEGEGSGAHLRNEVTDRVHVAYRFVLDLGNYTAAALLQEPRTRIDTILPGQAHVRLLSVEPESNYQVGDIVWAYSSNASWPPIRNFLQFNRIIGREEDRLFLHYPWLTQQPVITASIAKSSGRLRDASGAPRRMVRRVRLKNLRLSVSAADTPWSAAGGTMESEFENLLLESVSPVYGNAISYSRYKSIRATFARRVVELSGYSHDNIVESLHATYRDQGSKPRGAPLISFNENANRNCLRSFLIDGRGSREANLFRALYGSDNVVRDGIAVVPDLSSTAISISPSVGRSEGNLVEDLEVYAPADAEIVSCRPAIGSKIDGTLVRRVIAPGDRSSELNLTACKPSGRSSSSRHDTPRVDR